MLFAERNDPARRGTAMGWLIASTSVGYAASLFLSGLALSIGGYRTVFLVTGFTPTLGAVLLCLCLRRVENRIHLRTAKLKLSGAIFGTRDARLLTVGYTAHCWELLGSWAWLPSLIAAAYAMGGAGIADASRSSAWSTGFMHVLGAGAAFAMGLLSDRVGRRAVLLGVAAAAAVLSMSIGWMVVLPVALLVPLVLIYAFLTIGDSPVLTTAITEVTEPGYMGAMLAVRSLLGFGAGAVAPLAAGAVFDWTSALGLPAAAVWGCTFGSLGTGGILAAVSAAGLRRRRAQT
jgi:MFS family permease